VLTRSMSPSPSMSATKTLDADSAFVETTCWDPNMSLLRSRHLAGQAMQVVLESRNFPLGQEAHRDAPANPYRPALQLFPHPLALSIAPFTFPYFPAAHKIFVVVFGQYAPAGQGGHAAAPSAKLYLPTVQFAHATLSTVCPVRFPYFPAGQGDITPSGQYDPIGHRVQFRESIDSANE
jgi:hypothetical protein